MGGECWDEYVVYSLSILESGIRNESYFISYTEDLKLTKTPSLRLSFLGCEVK